MAKTELEDAGEEVDDMITSTSKLRDTILGMTGVDIMLDENTFKSTYQILKELAPAYKELSDIEQASLLETLAGKNRANVLASILQNADVLENAYTTSINSAGSATKEYETYLDSIEGKINTLRANYEVLSEDILNSDLIKDGLDIANDFVETIDKLIDGGNALMPILTGLSTILLTKSGFGSEVYDRWVGAFGKDKKNSIQQFSQQMKSIESKFEIGEDGIIKYAEGVNKFKESLYEASKAANVFMQNGKKLFDSDGNIVESYWTGMGKGYEEQEKVINEIIGEFSEKGSHAISAGDLENYFVGNTSGIGSSFELLKEYTKEMSLATDETKRKGVAEKYTTLASLGHNKAMGNAIKTGKTGKALTAAYAKELVGLKAAEIGATIATQALNAAISFGVSALVSVGISLISHLFTQTKELAEAGAEAAESYKNEAESLQELIDKYKTLANQLDNDNLSDKERYTIRNNILEVQKEVVNQYGEEAKRLDLVNGKLSEQKEILQNIKEQESSNYLIDHENNIDEAIKSLNKRHNKGTMRWALGMANTIAANDYGISLHTGVSSFDLFKDVDVVSDMEKFRKIVEKVGLTYTDYGQGFVGVDAVDKTDTETIEAWRELSKELSNFEPVSKKFAKQLQSFKNQISEEINDLNDETYQNNLKIIEQAVQGWIATDTTEQIGERTFRDFSTTLAEAQNDYMEAVLSNDKVAQQTAAQFINELEQDLENYTPSEDKFNFVKKYFEDVFKDNQHLLDVNAFKNAIDSDITAMRKYLESKGKEAFSGSGAALGISDALIDLMGDSEIDEAGLTAALMNTEKQGTKAYATLTKYAEEYNLTVEELVKVLGEVGWFDQNGIEGVSIVTKSFETLAEESKEATGNIDKFGSALSKLREDSDTVFTRDEINELIALYPQLLDKVELTAKGYKVSYKDLENAQNSYIKKEKERIQNEIEDNKAQIKLADRQIEALKTEGGSAAKTKEEIEKLETKKEDLNTQNEQLLFLQSQLGIQFDETTSKLKSLTDAYTGALNAVSALATEQSKYGKLSGESVLDFISQYPDDWQKFISYDNTSKSFTYNRENSSENVSAQLKDIIGYDPNEKLKELQDLKDFLANPFGTEGDVKNIDQAQKVLDKYDITIDGLDDKISQLSIETEAWEAALKDIEKEISATGAYDKYANAIEKINQAYENGEINASEKANQIRQAGIDYTSGLEEEGLSETQSATEAAKEVVSNEVNAIIDSYNDAVADADHQLNMGIISQATRDNMIAGANSKMIATAQSMGYINNKAIQDQIKSNEESVYQTRKTAAENEYNNEKEILDRLLADHEINGKEYQRRWKELNEKYWGNGTLLGSDESGIKTYESNLRDITTYSLDIVEKTQSDIKNLYDEGKIDVYEYWSRYAEAAQEIKDIPALSEDYESMMRTYFKDGYEEMYSETMDKAERAYDQGEISLTEYLNKCRKAYEQYYKDQTQFAKEALEAEQAMRDAYLNEIGQQINYLQKLSEKEAKPYQQRIDAIDKLQEKVDKEFDAEIKALETRKEALEEENEELDKQVAKEERLKELRDAQAATAKASLRTRLVYENGHFVAKRDENAYQEALANEKKVQDELQKDEREQKISDLEKQIKAFQDQKDTADEDFENQKQFFQDIIDGLQEPYNQIIGLLEDIRDESSVTNVDPNFISTLLQSETGKQLLSDRHEVGHIYNELATQYGQEAIAQMSPAEIAQKVTELAAKENKTADEVAKKLGYVGISDSSITPEDKKKIDNVLTFFSPNTSGTTVNKSSGVKQNEDVLSKMGNQSNYLSPTININVQGNADKSTISQMKTMLTQTLTDYTNRVTAAMNSAFTKTATVV